MDPNPWRPIELKPVKRRRSFWSLAILVVAILAMIVGSFMIVGHAPSDFESGTIVTVGKGMSVKDVGELLYARNVIRSASAFEFIVATVYGGAPVIEGDFQFDEKLNVLKVAERITGGAFGAARTKITIPEGSSVSDIARLVSEKIPTWNADEFVARAKSSEGYLFPETYFFFKTTTPDDVISKLKSEYEKRVDPLRSAMKTAGRSESDIIIMASILEKEARNADEAKIISGILWKRMKNNIALQVDAPFLYVINKTADKLTKADLQKDGPYNTYTRRGLPAGPIGNPGIAMITAAIHPVASDYLYYLHGKDGMIRYAKTYDGHLANINKYLR